MFKRFVKMLKCDHHFIPQYQLFMAGGKEKNTLYVSKCRHCPKHQYKTRAQILKAGAKK